MPRILKRSQERENTLDQLSDIKRSNYEFYLCFILICVVVFLIMNFYAGGMLRHSLGVLILFLIGAVIGHSMFSKTEKKEILKNEVGFEKNFNSQVKETSKLIKRAFNDQEVSQKILERKLKRICIKRIMNEKNLSEKEMKALIKKPEKLKEVTNDESLTTFLSKEKLEQGDEYKEMIDNILELLERDEICS